MTRYTPWVVSEHAPDFSTLEAIVKSRRFDGLEGKIDRLYEFLIEQFSAGNKPDRR